MIEMKLEQTLEVLHTVVPESEELDFDRIGMIQKPTRDIKKVGICVDLTDHVMEEVRKNNYDFLIIHHGRWQGS